MEFFSLYNASLQNVRQQYVKDRKDLCPIHCRRVVTTGDFNLLIQLIGIPFLHELLKSADGLTTRYEITFDRKKDIRPFIQCHWRKGPSRVDQKAQVDLDYARVYIWKNRRPRSTRLYVTFSPSAAQFVTLYLRVIMLIKHFRSDVARCLGA